MASFDLAALTAPVSSAEPCGPDLDLEDDDAYMNFMSATEMALPEEYFVVDHLARRVPFHQYDRFQDLNLKERLAAAAGLLDRTRDLRLLFLVAKLQILDKSLAEFQTTVEAMAVLLETYWDELNPRAEGGDFSLRKGILERLDDTLIISALNNAPLFRSRRYGVITGLSYAAAVRQIAGDQDNPDTSSIDRFLLEESQSNPDELIEARTVLAQLRDTLQRIRAVCLERAGSNAPLLQKLPEATANLASVIARINPAASESDAIEPDENAPDGTARDAVQTNANAGALFKTSRAAVMALAAAAAYFAEAEPSSPALLLIRQAQALVGKSFLEAMEMLLPDQVREVSVNIGTSPVFKLPLAMLSAREVTSERSDDADENGEAEMPARVQSRAEAIAILDKVGAYYRATEPSSPIPLLTGQARSLAGRDFVALIDSMLPKDRD
jgi:type VI secretion system protein ImpA